VPDVIDEHYYMNFSSALKNAHLYDNRPRTTEAGTPVPRIFVGEWATRDNNPTPTFHSALTDAAFLTGLQRNADLIIMSCYAPLFVNVNPGGQQWATDLIGYNTLTAFGSTSYYMQKMFYNARGDQVIPIAGITPQTVPTLPPEPAPPPTAAGARGGRGGGPPNPNEPIFACASKEDASGDVILKVVNVFGVDQTLTVEMAGANILKNATGQVMVGELNDTNTADDPFHIVPKDFVVNDASSTWTHTFPGNSITVIRFKTKGASS
jgi:alpha-N-arabinofuranosidase